MTTLKDILDQQQGSVGPTAAQPVAAQGNTEGLASLLAAGQNKGSAAGEAGPRIDFTQEQGAAASVAADKAQQGTEEQLAAQAIAQKGEELSQQSKDQAGMDAQRLSSVRSALQDQRAELTATYQAKVREGDSQAASAVAQQLAQDSRFHTDTYIEQLNYAAAQNGLNDLQKFRMAALDQELGDQKAILSQAAGQQIDLDATGNALKRAEGRMNIDMAIALVTADLKRQQQAGMYTAAGKMVSAGASYAAGKKSTATEPEGTAPVGDTNDEGTGGGMSSGEGD